MLNFDPHIIVREILREPSLNKLNKAGRIKELIHYRQIYFEKDKEVQGRIIKTVKESFEKEHPSFSNQDCIGDLYKDEFYSLSSHVLGEDRYKSN